MGKENKSGDGTSATPSSPRASILPIKVILVAMISLRFVEAERAGAKVARTLTADAGDGAAGAALKALAMDEARFCAMLAGHIKRLEAEPSQRTGAFREKVLALEGLNNGCVCSTGARNGLSASLGTPSRASPTKRCTATSQTWLVPPARGAGVAAGGVAARRVLAGIDARLRERDDDPKDRQLGASPDRRVD